MTQFEIRHDAQYHNHLYVQTYKFNAGNQRVLAQEREIAAVLVRPGGANETAKALVQGQWHEAENCLMGIPYLVTGATLWLFLPDGWYWTDRSLVQEISRERVEFTDGSILEGECALFFWAHLQGKDNRRYYYRIIQNVGNVTHFQQINNRANTFVGTFLSEDVPTSHSYSGGSSPKFNSPIANQTPYKIHMIEGYSTVANGWADNIYVHPNSLLQLAGEGNEYSFSRWKDSPLSEKNISMARTVLRWDENNQEIIVTE